MSRRACASVSLLTIASRCEPAMSCSPETLTLPGNRENTSVTCWVGGPGFLQLYYLKDRLASVKRTTQRDPDLAAYPRRVRSGVVGRKIIAPIITEILSFEIAI